MNLERARLLLSRLGEMVNATFIYSLSDPVSGECRYVGKSHDPFRRYQRHLSHSKKEFRTKNIRALRWIKGLLDKERRPTLSIIEWVPRSEWQEREIYWISFFRNMGCDLTNTHIGGLGGSDARGLVFTDEHRANISLSRRGKKFGPRGPFSKEAREAIRQGLIKAGVKPPPHAYEMALLANRGRVAWNRGLKMSPETCAKLSQMRIGNKHTLGRKDSLETRERKRQAQLRRWSSR